MLLDLFRFLRLLTIEPFLFLFLVSHVVQKFPQDQLIQDKLCIQKYGLSAAFCKDLPKMPVELDPTGKKSAILSDVTQFNQLIILVITVPTVIICLFIGHFIDQNQNGKRVVIVLSTVAITLETILLFLNSFYFELDYNYLLAVKLLQGLVGYPLTLYTAVWSYVLTVTPVQYRAIRTTIILTLMYGSNPIGMLLAGMNLGQDPLFPDHELRNYSTVYLIAFTTGLLSLIGAWWLIDEDRDRQLYCRYFPSTTDKSKSELKANCDIEASKLIDESFEYQQLEQVIDQNQNFELNVPTKQAPKSIWKLLFDIENIRQMSTVFFKYRPNQNRMQLHLSSTAMCLYVLSKMAMDLFGYQYVERVFNWDMEEFGLFLTVSYTVNIATSILVAPIILKIFQITNLTMSLIALSSFTAQNVIRSLSTEQWSFHLSIGFYSLNLLTTVGFRAYISTIIEPNELGSVFGMLSLIESFIPLLSSLVLSTIFRMTIDSLPTFSFAIAAAISGTGLVCGFIVRKKSNSQDTFKQL